MSSTLSEGVRVPDIGSVNWGADVNFNWGLLNTCLANISGNVKVDAENTWTAPQTFTETISGSIDGVAARAVGDEDGNNIKTALAGKQPSLSQAQLDACNSGVTSAAVQQIGTNASNISGLQTAVASKAADADVVHKAGAETISGDKTFTGATVTHNITPETDNTYSLGSSSYQWASVYAQTYYYKGTAWGLDKYNQWTEVNDFGNLIGLNGAELWFKNINIDDFTTNPAEVSAKSILQLWNKNTTQYSGGLIDYQMTDGSHVLEIVCFGYPLNSTTPYQHRFRFAAYRDGGADFYPIYNGGVNLGTSSNKWKTLNGINPGGLSFPNNSAAIDISANISDRAYGTNSFVSPATGWISVNSFATAIQIADDTTEMAITGSPGPDGYAAVFLPVRAGDSIRILINQTSTTFQGFKLYPCLGNV